MAKRRSVDDLYSEGRHYPRGQNRDAGARRSAHEWPMESAAANRTAHNTSANQMPEDFHDVKYDNEASGWVRGAGEDATRKPASTRAALGDGPTEASATVSASADSNASQNLTNRKRKP
jgi:hypothetical protein